MPYTMKFMAKVWAAFLARVNPVSTIANPACMNITRKPVTSVHTKLIATVFAAAAALAARASESAASAAGTAGAASAKGHTSPNNAPTPAQRANRFAVIRSPWEKVCRFQTVSDFMQKMHEIEDTALHLFGLVRLGVRRIVQMMQILDDSDATA